MRFSFFIIALLFCRSVQVTAQQISWHWGAINCPLSKDDSTFITGIETKMRREAIEKNSLMVYTGNVGGQGYRVKMSKVEMLAAFSDSTLNRTKFSSAAELAMLWNSTADTCMFVSFQHINQSGWNYGFLSCLGHVPLYQYKTFLEQKEMLRLRELIINSWMRSMNATRSGDTLFRIVRFNNDTDVYLPQASWKHLGWKLSSAMLGGAMSAYTDQTLSRPMSMQQINDALVQWDTTIQVEDPNSPGPFILAPVKHEENETGIVIYERWIRDETIVGTKPQLMWNPGTYMYYHRELVAYGTEFTSGGIIWYRVTEVTKAVPYFDWSPYDHSFRAERFQTMHIALEP